MKAISVPTYLNIDLSFELTNTGTRLGAFVIDWVIKWVYFFVISTTLNLNIFSSSLLYSFIVYSPFIFYSFIFEWLNKGQTLGKMLFKCRVVGVEGNYPSVYQCATRWVFLSADMWLIYIFIFVHPTFAALAIFSPFIGGLLIMLTDKHQRLGDMAAHTIVITTKQKEVYIYDTIYAYANTRKGYEPKYPEIMRLSDKDITLIKSLFERGNDTLNSAIANKLAKHIKQILKIESEANNVDFLRQLLNDYNHFAINEVG